MAYELIEESQVSLYRYPKIDEEHHIPHSEFTFGDLHGNTIKFLFILIKQGIVSDLNEIQYYKLLTIYNKSTRQLTQEDIQEFKEIIQAMKVNKNCFVRLIGDELGDRGNNDYFTLLILEKLHQEQLPMEILISNHGAEFLGCYANRQKFQPSIIVEQTSSLHNVATLINKKLLSVQEVGNLTNNVYKPYLKAISYSLSEDKNEISIYSHAPIAISTVKLVANQFCVAYEDSSAEKLAQTIDRVNAEFKRHVDANTISSQLQENHPLHIVIWSRDLDIDRKSQHENYHVNFIHGHTGNEGYYKGLTHIINLNNYWGHPGCEKGRYVIFYMNPKTHGNRKEEKLFGDIYEAISDEEGKNTIKENYIKFRKMKISLDDFKKIISEQMLIQIHKNAPEISKLCRLACLLFVESKELKEALLDIQKKSEEFNQDGEIEHYEEAKKLFETIIKNYLSYKNTLSFAENSILAVDSERKKFGQHRNYFSSTIDYLAKIISIVALLLKIFTGHSELQSDSHQKIQKLKAILDSLKNEQDDNIQQHEEQMGASRGPGRKF